MKKFALPMFLLVLLTAGVACSWIEIKLEPPPGTGTPHAEFRIEFQTQTPSPSVTSTPASGMVAINQTQQAGGCPDPNQIPVWLDVKDPETGQLCPKVAQPLSTFPQGVTSP